MHGLNTQDVQGHEDFLKLLDERADISRRQRGLITGEHAYIYYRSLVSYSSFLSLEPHLYVRM